MGMKINNLGGFLKGIDKHIEKTEMKIGERVKIAVRDLVLELASNIPVWSGRTVSSITVSNNGAVAPLQGEPTNTQAFGFTSQMPLGQEPMRASAEAKALRSVDQASYNAQQPVFITVHSEAWGLVERGRAPDENRARNQAVVSEIALSRIRARYDFLK